MIFNIPEAVYKSEILYCFVSLPALRTHEDSTCYQYLLLLSQGCDRILRGKLMPNFTVT